MIKINLIKKSTKSLSKEESLEALRRIEKRNYSARNRAFWNLDFPKPEHQEDMLNRVFNEMKDKSLKKISQDRMKEIDKRKEELFSILGRPAMINADFCYDPPRIKRPSLGDCTNLSSRDIEWIFGNWTNFSSRDIQWIIEEEIPLELLKEYRSFNTYVRLSYPIPSSSDDLRLTEERDIWLVRRMINELIDANNDYWSNITPQKLRYLVDEEIHTEWGFFTLKDFGMDEIVSMRNVDEVREAVSKFNMNRWKFKSHARLFTPIAVGSGSFILLYKDDIDERVKYACKYGGKRKLNREFMLLLFKGPTKNVINLFDKRGLSSEAYDGINNSCIPLEYINGKTLEEVVRQEMSRTKSFEPNAGPSESNILPSEKVLRYAKGIFNGLLELRQNGIYHHRDIRPANIMIRKEDDQPVILDLGIATKDKDALPKDNERFGGSNDLVSLGQVIYFMATARHLFSHSDSMRVTKIKRSIADEREKVYADISGKLLNEYLSKVKKDISDDGIKSLVETCLKAKGTDEDYQILDERLKYAT